MPDAELTSVQRYVLVTLMIKASALTNVYLTKEAHIALKKSYRDDLRKRGLITVVEKPQLVMELTEKGWGQAIKELGAEAPDRAGSAGGALYTTLTFLRSLLDHLGVAPWELFTLQVASAEGKAVSAPAGLADTIRRAYSEIAPRAGDYVPLTQVRKALRTDIDATLVAMDGASDVSLIPNSQQGDLTEDDRAAAVRIGNQDTHLIAIGS